MTWGRPGWGEKGRRGGEEQVGTGESWMGGGTWEKNVLLGHLKIVSPGLCNKLTRSVCSGSS